MSHKIKVIGQSLKNNHFRVSDNLTGRISFDQKRIKISRIVFK